MRRFNGPLTLIALGLLAAAVGTYGLSRSKHERTARAFVVHANGDRVPCQSLGERYFACEVTGDGAGAKIVADFDGSVAFAVHNDFLEQVTAYAVVAHSARKEVRTYVPGGEAEATSAAPGRPLTDRHAALPAVSAQTPGYQYHSKLTFDRVGSVSTAGNWSLAGGYAATEPKPELARSPVAHSNSEVSAPSGVP